MRRILLPIDGSKNSDKAEINTVLTEQGDNVLKDALNKFGPYKGKVDTVQKYGDPDKVIITYPEENCYDLVVMVNRGPNAISRFMLDSVSLKVLNHINISVLIDKC